MDLKRMDLKSLTPLTFLIVKKNILDNVKHMSKIKFNLIDVSKCLSHILRHEPEKYNLKLSENGWADLYKVLNILSITLNTQITENEINLIINNSEKIRFEINGNKIRAKYGHSTLVPINYKKIKPPKYLYHATTPEKSIVIIQTGLKSMKRQYVHMAEDFNSAIKVALRYSTRPVLLEVDANQAYLNQINFYHGGDDIWLADFVPPKYIKLIPLT